MSDTESHIYVEVRVFRWSPAGSELPTADPDGTISRCIAQFANLSNATAVYEDCEKPLLKAIKDGLPLMVDRRKPGPVAKASAVAAAS